MNFELKKLYLALFIPVISSLLMIAVFVVSQLPGMDFHYAGIFPRQPESIGGILSVIFIHASAEHLFNNVLSFLMLSGALFYVYRQIAFKVFIFSWISSGIILWIIGRDSWHVGSSGLIYSMAFFLFFSGIFRWHAPLIALSLLVTLIYGNMIWHLMPWEINDPVSWEGHLAGGMTGTVLSVIYRNHLPQKPVVLEDEEDNEDDFKEEKEDEDEKEKIFELKMDDDEKEKIR